MKKLKKDILKRSLKVVKYLCDVSTSYNNYSWKVKELDPVVGGGLSVVSSLVGMALLWGFWFFYFLFLFTLIVYLL